MVGSVALLLQAQVDGDRPGVGAGSIYGVAEVHQKRRNLPPDAGLDVRVGEVSSVEEVDRGDSD